MRSVIVAISVPGRVKRRLAHLDFPDKEDLPPYHVTVVYLGKLVDMNDATRHKVISTVYDVCSRHPPMVMALGGFGVFNPSESSDKAVLHYEIDSPGLAELSTDLTRALRMVTELKQEHGFVPHITVGYQPKDKSVSKIRIPDARFPSWTASSVEIIFGPTPVEIPLQGTLQMSMPFVSTLFKSRAAGSKNKIRRYLARIELPGTDASGNPRYEYIYPDTDEVESWNPKLGYTLKPKRGEDKPRSLSQIINDKLFGSYGVHKVKDRKTGHFLNEPWWKDGLFYAYAPDEPPKPGDTKARSSYAYLNRNYGDPIDKDNIGKIRFNKYQKLPGFLNIELGPGVERKYTIPGKVMNLQLTDPESIKQAAAKAPGYSGPPIKIGDGKDAVVIHGIPEGTNTEILDPNRTSDTPAGEVNILNVPETSDQTESALSEPVPNTIDPFVYAARVIERAGKKKQTEVPDRAKVLPFPQDAIDAFGGEKELVHEFVNRPATTMVTLGKYNSSQRRVLEQLDKEWRGPINGLARDAFKWTYTLTGRYSKREAEDQASGFHAGTGPGLKSYRKEVMDDLVQQGRAELFSLAKEYADDQKGHIAGERPRFDAWVYPKLRGRLLDYSKEQAQQYEGGVSGTILDDGEIEEAARQQGYTVEMNPEEAAELSEIRRKAKAALLKVLMDKKIPKTYRLVFMARHYLDAKDAAKTEADSIDRRREAVGTKKELNYQPRPFTGPGSIAELYPEWTDTNGKQISFAGMAQTAQLYHLNKWYDAAQSEIYRRFTKPTVDSEGEVDEDKRVLTNSGAIVKDWLHLEGKLASGNKRLYEDRQQHERILVREKIPTATSSTRPVKELAVHNPAVTFFTENPELSARLGLDLDRHLDLTSAMYQGTAAQHHVDIAERYHKTLLDLKGHSHQKLTSMLSSTAHAVNNLHELGSQHLEKLHNYTVEYQKHSQRLAADVAKLRVDRQAYAKQRHVISLAAKNPISKREDKVGHDAYNHVVKIGNIKDLPTLEAGIRDFIQTNASRWPGASKGKVLDQFVSNIRKEFVKVGAVSLGESKAKVAELKARAEAIRDDRDHKNIRQKVGRIANKIAEIKVGDTPVGANIVQAYTQHLLSNKPLTSEHLESHRTSIQAAAQHLEGELELLRFERDQRRVVKKSDILFKSIYGLKGVLQLFTDGPTLSGPLVPLLVKSKSDKRPNHVAYTRRSKSGKISLIRQKGSQPAVVVPVKADTQTVRALALSHKDHFKDTDEHAHEFHLFLHKRKVKTERELHDAARDFVNANYEGPPKTLNTLINNFIDNHIKEEGLSYDDESSLEFQLLPEGEALINHDKFFKLNQKPLRQLARDYAELLGSRSTTESIGRDRSITGDTAAHFYNKAISLSSQVAMDVHRILSTKRISHALELSSLKILIHEMGHGTPFHDEGPTSGNVAAGDSEWTGEAALEEARVELAAQFLLRNVIDKLGLEIKFSSPILKDMVDRPAINFHDLDSSKEIFCIVGLNVSYPHKVEALCEVIANVLGKIPVKDDIIEVCSELSKRDTHRKRLMYLKSLYKKNGKPIPSDAQLNTMLIGDK